MWLPATATRFSMTTKIYSVKNILVLAAILFVAAGCSRGSSVQRRSGASTNIPNNYTIFDDVDGNAPQSCAAISGTVTRISPTGDVGVGQDVVFEINVLNCNKYRVERLDGAPGGTFNQAKIWYTKKFTSTSASQQEIIRIIGIDSEGQDVPAILVYAQPFAIGEGSANSLSCSASPLTPVVTIQVDPQGMPIEAPPVVQFKIDCNRSIRVVGVRNFATQNPMSSPGALNVGQSVVVPVLLTAFYQSMVEFSLEDAATPSITKKVSANVYVQPIAMVAAPTCTITPSKTVAAVGEVVNFRLTLSGSVSQATMNGLPALNNAQLNLPIYAQTKVVANLVGPGGSGGCEAIVNVVATPVQIGVNFEDATDGDYNDSVFCMKGLFKIEGNEIISLADQTVNVRSFTSSAYNHSVRVQVWNPAGFIEFEKSYKTSTKPTYTAQFQVGSRLRVEFKSDKGPHSQLFYSQGSEWVRHGHFCNGGSAQ